MNDATDSQDPFHQGEREIQQRLGVREALSRVGKRAIRDHLIDQHRAFYEQIPDIYYGAYDAEGNLWASMLWGAPGFLVTPNEHTLAISPNVLAGDPAFDALGPMSEIGILGLMFHTRRRNRASGVIARRDDASVIVDITQSFGNCPKYIQSRNVVDSVESQSQVTASDSIQDLHRTIISQADTFFIASHYADENGPGQGGIDMSHRGGKPGFVHVDDSGRITWPDFAGNNFFNTLGNLIKNPHAGLFFMDYVNGDVLFVTGSASILWDDETTSGFAGSERLIQFEPRKLIHVTAALPWRWSAPEVSPFLEPTGSWPETT